MSSLFGIGANGAASFYNGVATQSLRFDGGAKLTRTPSSSGNQKKWTSSFWVKRSSLGTTQYLWTGGSYSGNDGIAAIYFGSDDKIHTYFDASGSNPYGPVNARLYRDTSAWYHIVWAVDAANTVQKIWVNGVEETLASGNNPPNFDYGMNRSGTLQTFGIAGWGGSPNLNGYLAEITHLDNQYLDETYFGEFKNGVWIAKDTSDLTFGTNGFRLQLDQTGVGTASASTIGADTSGNTHHFTSSGIVASDCAMPDCPENNFCTWNPLTIGAQGTLAEGNLKNTGFWSADLSGNASTFFPESGKWYWELRIDGASTYPYIGITSQEKVNDTVNGGTFYNIAWRVNGTGVSSGSSLGTITKENIPSFADNDIISFALDVDARKLWVAENNTYADSGNPANGSGENASWTVDVGVSPFVMGYNGHGDDTITNFGQDDTFAGAISSAGNTDGNGKGVFKYAPPSGFLALCTANLPEPTIGPNSATQADDYFNTVLYTGNASPATHTIGFRPNWVWGKKRGTNAQNHWWINDVVNINKWLSSDGDGGEGSEANGTTFNATSFTTANNDLFVNNNSPYVVWAWKGNGTGTAVSNSDGSIASTVSANTAAGFSVIAYTGNNGSSATIGHGLGAVPQMIIIKSRDNSRNWTVYHEETGNTKFLTLNATNAAETASNRFNDTSPNSTVFTIGTSDNVNASENYIAWCFAEVDGYSKIGSYIGNGNNDGTFVYLGFRPAFIMIKRAVGGTGVYSSWAIYDNKRKTINSDVGTDSNPLFANKNSQEGIRGNGSNSISGTRTAIDFLSNGFKLRDIANEIGVDGNTYIYMAFAEEPFKYANSK
jgi:hypothetical protein